MKYYQNYDHNEKKEKNGVHFKTRRLAARVIIIAIMALQTRRRHLLQVSPVSFTDFFCRRRTRAKCSLSITTAIPFLPTTLCVPSRSLGLFGTESVEKKPWLFQALKVKFDNVCQYLKSYKTNSRGGDRCEFICRWMGHRRPKRGVRFIRLCMRV